MDIKYCFKCRKKIPPDKVCTYVMDDGKQRDFCQPCWKQMNPDGTLETVQEQEARTGKKKGLSDSRSSRRKPSSSLYDSAILTLAREREKQKTRDKKNTRAQRRPESDPGSSRPGQRTERRPRGKDVYIDDRPRSPWIPLILLLLVIGAAIAVAVVVVPKLKQNQQHAASGDDQANQPQGPPDASQEYKDQLAEIERNSASGLLTTVVEKQKLELLLISVRGTNLEETVSRRIQALEGHEALAAMMEKSPLKLQTMFDQYSKLIQLKGIGNWEKRIQDTWKQAIGSYAKKSEALFNEGIIPALDAARETRDPEPAYKLMDDFINNVEPCAAAPKNWHKLVEEERARLKRMFEEKPVTPVVEENPWRDALADDEEYAKLTFGGTGTWQRNNGLLSVVNEAGDCWVVLDVSEIERYDVEFALKGDCNDMYIAFRFEGDTVDIMEDFVRHVKYNSLDTGRHTFRVGLQSNGKLSFIVDGRGQGDGTLWTKEKTQGKFAICFRGGAVIEFNRLRYRKYLP